MSHIFISYRRSDGFAMANLLYEKLTNAGYSVFLDTNSLQKGPFPQQLLEAIKTASDFMPILSPSCFFNISRPKYNPGGDWMVLEILYAQLLGKNVVPIVDPEFVFPEPEEIPRFQFQITDEIAITMEEILGNLRIQNYPPLHPEYFNEWFRKVRGGFLQAQPSNIQQSAMIKQSSGESESEKSFLDEILDGVNEGLDYTERIANTASRVADFLSLFDDDEGEE